jgi:quaternary ammonium compound-resistance protein SugE
MGLATFEWVAGTPSPTPDSDLINAMLAMTDPWILLIIAGLFEVGFAFCLGKAKQSTESSMYWYIGFLCCLAISMLLLVKVTQQLPIGTAYAVWTGIGATGTALLGIFIFKESMDFWRLFFISTLIISVVGLKWVSN